MEIKVIISSSFSLKIIMMMKMNRRKNNKITLYFKKIKI